MVGSAYSAELGSVLMHGDRFAPRLTPDAVRGSDGFK
jgi:hypothetical protein